MHPKFENRLEYLSELANEDLSSELSQEERGELDSEIEGALAGYARRSGTSIEGEIEIYGMQLRKQERMQKLHEELRQVDSPEGGEVLDANLLHVTYEDGMYQVMVDGEVCEMTRGEVMTAGEWGYQLQLDATTVPRSVRKRFLVENAKREIRSYLDEQIYLEEVNSNRNRTYVSGAYSAMLNERDENLERKGVIAEKVVATFFERLQYDSQLDFTLEPVDIYQDVIQKVDFVIKKRRHERGVRVEEGGGSESTGIQFTINSTPEVLAKKQAQVDRSKSYIRETEEVQDILLVSLSPEVASEVWEAYQNWKEAGQPVAVDGYLYEETKELLFRNILKDIYTEEEIDEQWGLISGVEEEPVAA